MQVSNINRSLILASQSPRRKQILTELGFNFMVKTNDVEEILYPHDLALEKVPEYLSNIKAEAAKKFITKEEIIIAADTIVLLENQILGKPGSIDNAIQMLQLLSNKKHTVISGVTLLSNNKKISFSEMTHVYFKKLETENIKWYVEKFKPLDKAGSYAIQEWIGMTGIEKIEGCYYNVVGLPASRLVEKLNSF